MIRDVTWRLKRMTPDEARHYHARIDGIIDEIAVERLAAGEQIWATHAERVAAAQTLRARGFAVSQVAVRMRISERTIERYWTDGQVAA